MKPPPPVEALFPLMGKRGLSKTIHIHDRRSPDSFYTWCGAGGPKRSSIRMVTAESRNLSKATCRRCIYQLRKFRAATSSTTSGNTHTKEKN